MPYQPTSLTEAGVDVEEKVISEAQQETNLTALRVTQLQELCISFEVAHSGLNKEQLKERLSKFLGGHPVPRRGGGKKFIVSRVEGSQQVVITPVAKPTSKPKAKAKSASMGYDAPDYVDESLWSKNAPIWHMKCEQCNAPMMGCVNRANGNKFFGCSRFGVTGCRFNMTYYEGLTEFRASLVAAAGSRAAPSSSASGTFR